MTPEQELQELEIEVHIAEKFNLSKEEIEHVKMLIEYKRNKLSGGINYPFGENK
jgi:hypothetical protein